jgi:hypothetical protein
LIFDKDLTNQNIMLYKESFKKTINECNIDHKLYNDNGKCNPYNFSNDIQEKMITQFDTTINELNMNSSEKNKMKTSFISFLSKYMTITLIKQNDDKRQFTITDIDAITRIG